MAIVLGVDYGTRRIGIAVSDADEKIALVAGVLQATGDPHRDAHIVAEEAKKRRASRIVVGLPLNMDGSEGPQAKITRKFAECLRKVSGLPVDLWDERLSSAAADWSLQQLELSRGKRKARRDAISAQIILQGWLDAKGAGSADEKS